MRTIFWLNGWLTRILCALAIAAIVAMTLGISAEVILRIFSFPSIMGMIELTEYGLFISTFFVVPYLLRTNEHIRVDILMSRVDANTARLVELSVLAVIIVISVITGLVGTAVMVSNGLAGTLIFKDLVFPQWWLDWIIPFTCLVMTVQAIEMMVQLWSSSKPVSHEASEHVPGIRPEEMP